MNPDHPSALVTCLSARPVKRSRSTATSPFTNPPRSLVTTYMNDMNDSATSRTAMNTSVRINSMSGISRLCLYCFQAL
ncbi:Uncharacterised protein [uncultured archaeon]|nr:Uncharacterised protein [uncultured archaeon]